VILACRVLASTIVISCWHLAVDRADLDVVEFH